jgi:hypothetical protein
MLIKRRARAVKDDDALWWTKCLYEGYPPDKDDFPRLPLRNTELRIVTVLFEHDVGVKRLTMPFRFTNMCMPLE